MRCASLWVPASIEATVCRGAHAFASRSCRWALNAAALSSGAGVKKIFAKYDRDGSGQLSEMEFCQAMAELGLADKGEELFYSLPGSHHGYVSYLELVEQAQVRCEARH